MNAYSHQITIDNGQGLINPIKYLNPSTYIKPVVNKVMGKIMKPFTDATQMANEYETLIEQQKADADATQAAINQRNEEWARADAIQKHIEEREDSQLQRWVADAIKSGINPNLAIGMQGSPSGGGITNQTGSMDYTKWQAQYNKDLELLKQMIDQNFQGNENEKDRFNNILSRLISLGTMAQMVK